MLPAQIATDQVGRLSATQAAAADAQDSRAHADTEGAPLSGKTLGRTLSR